VSTKIYNGLRLRGHTLEQALVLLKSIRPGCVEAARSYTAGVAAQEMAETADLAFNFPDVDGSTPWWSVHERIVEARQKVLGRGQRSVTWDSSFDICLIPYKGYILALYYIENDHGYVKALKEAGFEDFSYQNCTDRPASVTEFQWSARAQAWDAALPGATCPAGQGFTYCVVSWDDYSSALYDRELLRASIPSEEVRRRAVAIALAEKQVQKENEGLSPIRQLARIRELAPTLMGNAQLNPEMDTAIFG